MKKVILVFVELPKSRVSIKDTSELELLSKAAGLEVCSIATQKRNSIDSRTFIGKGKASEIALAAKELSADLVIFDNILSASHMRNLSEIILLPVIDRTSLILDIFAMRSSSAISKMQVELAQLKYTKSHLSGIGKLLSQQGAGIGTRGPGETKLETDRRRIDSRISFLNEKIKSNSKQLETQRKSRKNNSKITVGLVGYTNSGKSTLMNYFVNNYSNPDNTVFVKDMLFASLDTAVRNIEYDNTFSFLLLDTVGFVNRLPEVLVDSFKSTLDEILLCDIILHIVDGSGNNIDENIKATVEVINEIGGENIPRILVYNKLDKMTIVNNNDSINISALHGTNINKLVDSIKKELNITTYTRKFSFPFSDSKEQFRLKDNAEILEINYSDSGTIIKAKVNSLIEKEFRKYLM